MVKNADFVFVFAATDTERTATLFREVLIHTGNGQDHYLQLFS